MMRTFTSSVERDIQEGTDPWFSLSIQKSFNGTIHHFFFSVQPYTIYCNSPNCTFNAQQTIHVVVL